MVQSQIKTALLGGVSLLAASAALAQDTGDAGIIELDPINVYGDRSATDLSDSTASVAIIPEDRLDTPTTQTVTDTFRQTVNVTDGDFTESGFVIRGINSEGLTPGGAGAPLASIYIDGVQQTAEAARRGMRSVFDAEQVEIYRGPQSTLTGRNALAGAIYVRTKDPEFYESGKVELTYGENNKREVGLAYGGALTENLAYRLSGVWSSKDTDLNYPSYANYPGYGDLTQDGYYTVRGKLLWLPTHSDDTRVLLSYSHSYDSPDSDDIAGSNWQPGSGVSFADRRGDVWGALTPPTNVPGLGALPIVPLALYQDVRTTKVDNLGIEITHDFNENLTLTAMTSVSDSRTDRNSVNYGYDAPLFINPPIGGFLPFNPEAWTTTGGFDQRIISQEVRLNYESDGLRWVTGLYLADEQNEGNRDQFAIDQNTLASLVTTSTYNRNDISNYAVFGEVTYEFAPSWNVILGGRLEYYKQTQYATSQTTDYFTGASTFASSDSSSSETAFIPKLGVTYDINAYNRIGLVYQEGYRPGGSGIRLDTAQPFDYEEERAKNLELTWRGSLMDGRLNVGASLFYQDWDNQQVEIWQVPTDPNSSTIVNAGQSESYGAEIELAYQATDKLNIYGGLGLLHTEFKDFSIGGQNLAGQPYSNAPEQSVVIGFLWGDVTGWFAGGNVKYVASSLSRVEASGLRATLDDYTTVDAQLGYTWDHGLSVAAYATNLLDEEYFTYDATPSDTFATLGARREVGIRLSKTF
ncbi:TonB-dependent receptor [Sedimentitalea sp.]|uniref:TonB-dependent receptor n=1 Tax=Sedimentitalea sp. TaxID=2048915 RepID=UPI003298360B